jgi:glycosyltransferase involved in cell wall biosynthesis
MRLCLIANRSIHTRRFTSKLLEMGHEVSLVGFGPLQVPLPPGVRLLDVEARLPHAARGKARWPFWAAAVSRAVRDLRPDVLHAHQVATGGWLGAAAGYHPFLVTAWGSDLMVGARRSRPQRWLARWVFRKADYVTCVSQGLAAAALDLGARQGRLEVAPWGVDADLYHPAEDRAALREQLGLGPGPLVLSVRSVKPVYNPLDIARAIPLVLRACPRALFVVRSHNSDPGLLAQFREIVAEAGATASVRYIGELPDEQAIADYYRAADVALSVPSSDGTPSSVLEALACGAVPIVSDLPSLREWVEHEGEVLMVPVHDVQALAASIVRLLSEEGLRRALAAAGWGLVRRRADSRVMMRRYEEIYEGLVSPRPLPCR